MQRESGNIDWNLVRERMAEALRTGEARNAVTPEHSRGILQERARRLAQPVNHEEQDAGHMAMVVFAIGSEQYALETRFVREILRGVDITPLPETPGFVVGAAKLRGEIHAIFDIRSLLGASRTQRTSPAPIVALGTKRIEFGVLADDVHEIVLLPSSDILPPPVVKDEDGSRHVRGVTKDALVVLDGDALLEDRRLYVGSTGRD